MGFSQADEGSVVLFVSWSAVGTDEKTLGGV